MFITEAILCLALNVYHEAKNQPFIGQVAVAQVVMNRVYDERYPDTVCEVVEQGPTYSWKPDFPIRNRCQFSWYCDGLSDTPTEKDAWDNAIMVANGVYHSNFEDFVEGATHYHAYYVAPEWASAKTYIVRIEDHIFYRWDIEQ
jgi:spore germination cell wall hydrolase CwlJ-like protein|tara:strand:- start:63 stop:494 length:432 start_codon:yes stop_codon:yes gene_type:complete